MVFHLGKVLEVISFESKEVISSDATVQASVKMWDDNQLILNVDPKIALKVKKSDIVLVDYGPEQVGGQAVPRQLIVKILAKKTGEHLWASYKDYDEKRKSSTKSQQFIPEIGQGMIR